MNEGWRRGLPAAVWMLLAASLCAQESSPAPLEGVRDFFDKGGLVMVVIVALSVVGVALAMERLVSLRSRRLVPVNIKEGLERARSSGRIEELDELIQDEATPLARILVAGRKRQSWGIAEMERAMEAQGELECTRLRRPIRPLATLAQVEPLLGLLGTIIGMITTFNLLHTTSAAERVSRLAPGIGQALYTTAAGLAIAIPLVLLHHHLQGRVMRTVEEWNVLGTSYVELCHKVPHARSPQPCAGEPPEREGAVS